jgi:hypothetical protein
MSDNEPAVAGEALETLDDNRRAAAALAAQARRDLIVFSRDMDPPILDQESFLESVRQFAIRSGHTHVRVLLIDAARAVSEGHGLIRLAQRLPSHVSLHRVHQDDAGHVDAFICADRRGYLYRTLGDRHEGRWNSDSPLDARRLVDRFGTMWERSRPEPEFRKLGL